jgi:hypothetical protein
LCVVSMSNRPPGRPADRPTDPQADLGFTVVISPLLALIADQVRLRV